MSEMLPLLKQLYPLHRTLGSSDMRQAMTIIRDWLPSSWINHVCHQFEPWDDAWTWRLPPSYTVHDAYIEDKQGNRLVDYAVHALHLVDYSPPVDVLMTWDELKPHLHVGPAALPDAVPYRYSYYEPRRWGFCLSWNQYQKINRDQKFHVVIRAEYGPEGISVLQSQVMMADRFLLLSSHLCHPWQANDDLSGTVVVAEVLRRLAEKPVDDTRCSVVALFGPETVGTLAWFHKGDRVTERPTAALFVEMVGTPGDLWLQHSRQKDTPLDSMLARSLLATHTEWHEANFREHICNDEGVINGPGIDIPCPSLSRWPYKEYHTSLDTPDIISEAKLQEAADVVERAVRWYCQDYVPKRAWGCGPVMLSRYGLWVDWQGSSDARKANRAVERIMEEMDGKRSVWELAKLVDLSFEQALRFVNGLCAKGLVTR